VKNKSVTKRPKSASTRALLVPISVFTRQTVNIDLLVVLLQDWSLEQRWLAVLLLLLALYNNPLFPLTLSSLPLLVGVAASRNIIS
jgi:hypothetical protein